jgi:chromo domain-containing protein 1
MAPASNAGDPDPEDEDSDDISVTSTLESEMRSEYELSEILDEAVNHEGETVYLIRWEGYPLHRYS